MKLLVSISGVLALLFGSASARWLEVDASVGDGYAMEVVREDASEILVEFRLGRLQIEDVEAGGKNCVRVRVPGGVHVLERGAPEVPYVVGSVIVPDRGVVQTEVLEQEWEEIELGVLLPSKGNLPRSVNPANVPYEFGPSYEEWYPTIMGVEATDPFVLRDFRGVSLSFWPVRVAGFSGEARLLRKMLVRIRFEDGVGVNEKSRERTAITREFVPTYNSTFMNYPHQSRWDYIDERAGRLLIIAADQYCNEMWPLVEWKTQKGLWVEMVPVSQIGNEWQLIDQYIENRYYATGDLVFVLLVGSAQDVQPWGGMNQTRDIGVVSLPQDPMYVVIEGGDNFPDAIIGRFCADCADHVEAQVQKSVWYERVWGAQSPYWRDDALGIASNLGNPPDWQFVEAELQSLLGFTYDNVYRVYDPGATAGDVSAALNAGVSMTLYMGHGAYNQWGTSGFGNSDIDALTNRNRVSLAHSVACNTGQFHNRTCMGEKWLWKEYNGEPAGGIAFYGSVTTQDWTPPQAAQDGMVNHLTSWAYNTIGGIVFNGAIDMIASHGASGFKEYKYWHLFGDPSCQFRCADWGNMPDVVHLPGVPLGAEEFEVEVVGLPEALCAMSKDGVLYGSGYTGADGVVVIDFSQPVTGSGTMKLIVTAFNKVPYEEDIPIAAAPLTVDIDGPPALGYKEWGDWYADVDGGAAPYSYEWRRRNYPNGTWGLVVSYTDHYHGRMNQQHFELKLDVWDSSNPPQHAYATQIVWYEPSRGAPTSANDVAATPAPPEQYDLEQNHPNPFDASTEIRFQLPEPSRVLLSVYDIRGREMARLLDSHMSAGYHRATWDARDVPKGMYFYRLTTDGFTETKRLVVARTD